MPSAHRHLLRPTLLQLLDLCIKNSDEVFHVQCGDLAAVLALLAPHDPAAAKLLAQLSVAFARYEDTIPFKAHHDALAAKGFVFPPINVSEIEVYQPSRGQRPHSSPAVGPSSAPAAVDDDDAVVRQLALVDAAFDKLRSDLRSVAARVADASRRVCEGSVVLSDSSWGVEVVEFLEQCTPRLATLIEAGVSGALDEALFETCLSLNEAVARILEASQKLTAGSISGLDAASKLKDLCGFACVFDAQANNTANAVSAPSNKKAATSPVVAAQTQAPRDDLAALFGGSATATASAPATATAFAPQPVGIDAFLSLAPSAAATKSAHADDFAPFPESAPAPAPAPAPVPSSADVLADLDALIK
jgi:hypothetical protein